MFITPGLLRILAILECILYQDHNLTYVSKSGFYLLITSPVDFVML